MSAEGTISNGKFLSVYERFQSLRESDPGSEETYECLIRLEGRVREEIRVLLDRKAVLFSSEVLEAYEQDECGPVDRIFFKETLGEEKTMDGLLESLIQRIEEVIQTQSITELCERMNILLQEVDEVILPPDEMESSRIRGENGENVERPDAFPRFQLLIQLLRDEGVYTDDLMVIRGILEEDQMRAQSYLLVEIPRLNRSVLICNAYGEASFVYQGILSRQLAFQLTKEGLQERFEKKVKRIIYHDAHQEQWLEHLKAALFTEFHQEDAFVANTPKEKVNVRDQEAYRQEIFRQFPTPEEWMGMNVRKKSELKIYKKGLRYLANTVFGLKDANPIGLSRDMAQLGKKVYGEGFDIFEYHHWSQEDWTVYIRENVCAHPEEWIRMTEKEKQNLKIFGMGLVYIARNIFQLKDVNPTANLKDMAHLGKKIFGEGHGVLECHEWTRDEWSESIRSLYKSPEEWMNLKAREKKVLKIHGLGLSYLANSVFGFKDSHPITSSRDMAQLGKMIYGDGHHVLECFEWNKKKWAEYIRENVFSTPEEWMGMSQKRKMKLKIFGLGLVYLARIIFELERANPVASSRDMARLGREIYGKGHPILESYEWSQEAWSEFIRKNVSVTPEQWMSIRYKEKMKLKIFGIGLTYLANTIFELKDAHPISYSRDMARLGEKIYGPHEVFDQYLEDAE